MKRLIEGEDRFQSTLFPEHLDDYIGEDNPGRLMPDFKTIADFRKDNGKAIRSVCREFIVLCRDLKLFSEAIVAIDGSKFKAVNNRDKNFTDRKLKARMPDARSMATSGRGTGTVGYNVQTAVDTKHHMIVAHEVTNVGHRDQLSSMAHQARDSIGTNKLTVFADRGYFKGDEILECERAGIKALVPKSLTSNNRAAGLFDKADFPLRPGRG